MLPLALSLTNKRVLVLGAGKVAASKIALVLEQGANITVISPEVLVSLPEGVHHEARRYTPGDLEGFHLVISATGVPEVNDLVVAEANARGIWLNVVDDPGRCDFFFTAVHREGPVTVSVSSEGSAPALAQYLRDHVRATLPRGVASVAKSLRTERDAMHESGVSTESISWRACIEELFAAEGN